MSPNIYHWISIINTVSIWICIKTYMRQSNRIDKLLMEHLKLEFEVLKLLASGKSVSDIAKQFSLNVTTISTYRSRIMEKMNLRTNADLTLYAIENKLM